VGFYTVINFPVYPGAAGATLVEVQVPFAARPVAFGWFASGTSMSGTIDLQIDDNPSKPAAQGTALLSSNPDLSQSDEEYGVALYQDSSGTFSINSLTEVADESSTVEVLQNASYKLRVISGANIDRLSAYLVVWSTDHVHPVAAVTDGIDELVARSYD
jgi:hypothetical protein